MSRAWAQAAQAAALIAIGLVLIVAALTAPTPPPAAEPTPMRPATEQERRNYDARQLAELLYEQQRNHQQEGARPLERT